MAGVGARIERTMEKINIAKLLRDCPEGMELDCTMFDKPVKYIGLTKNETYMIAIKTSCDKFFCLTKEGYLYDTVDSKCIIFPKGKTTWEAFVPPCEFRDGDIITDSLGTCIFKGEGELEDTVDYYCGITGDYFRVKDNKCNPSDHYGYIVDYRLSTEEEKARLFQAIKDNGYRWNVESKILEKIEPKFDISTLIPFGSRVLVRDLNSDRWKVSFWGCLADDCDSFKYDTTRGYYKQCIPYEGNEHLLGKADDCDNFYKTWE